MPTHITLLHPWRFFAAVVLCFAIPVASYVAFVSIAMTRIVAEVHASELIAEQAIDVPKTAGVLSRSGITLNLNDSKASGLGAYIVQDPTLSWFRQWLTVVTVLGWTAAIMLAISCWSRIGPHAHADRIAASDPHP